MDIRLFIVSLACLSCLVPPALAGPLTVKALAVGAAKGALVKGAAVGLGVGLAAKGAMALVAKKALMGILLKAAMLKGALVAKKMAIKGGGALALKGMTGAMTAGSLASASADSFESDDKTTTLKTPLMDVVSGTARVLQSSLRLGEAIAQKSRALYRVMSMVPRMLDPTITD